MTTVHTSEPTQVRPRPISRRPTGGDAAYRGILTFIGALVLAVTGAIGIFLGYQLVPTLHRFGWKFLYGTNFNPSTNDIQIGSAIVGTVIIATIALVIAVPLALAGALYITEYAPRWLKGWAVAIMDLMAAVPSLIVGAFGLAVLMPHIAAVSRWLSVWLGWIPIFDIPGFDGSAANYQQGRYLQSPFIAGTIVAMMVVPLACSVMRNVFDQAPQGEREGALALGATRWGVIRSVVLPFGRGGMIGGIMLGLGRALGETIAVFFILSEDFHLKVSITDHGGVTISSLVATHFGDALGAQLDGLLAAGFVLFLMTLVVNTGAAFVVARSRSGADT